MCDILHIRHYKLWYRSDMIFKLLGLEKQQEKLLSIIHGLTGSVSTFNFDIQSFSSNRVSKIKPSEYL